MLRDRWDQYFDQACLSPSFGTVFRRKYHTRVVVLLFYSLSAVGINVLDEETRRGSLCVLRFATSIIEESRFAGKVRFRRMCDGGDRDTI